MIKTISKILLLILILYLCIGCKTGVDIPIIYIEDPPIEIEDIISNKDSINARSNDELTLIKYGIFDPCSYINNDSNLYYSDWISLAGLPFKTQKVIVLDLTEKYINAIEMQCQDNYIWFTENQVNKIDLEWDSFKNRQSNETIKNNIKLENDYTNSIHRLVVSLLELSYLEEEIAILQTDMTNIKVRIDFYEENKSEFIQLIEERKSDFKYRIENIPLYTLAISKYRINSQDIIGNIYQSISHAMFEYTGDYQYPQRIQKLNTSINDSTIDDILLIEKEYFGRVSDTYDFIKVREGIYLYIINTFELYPFVNKKDNYLMRQSDLSNWRDVINPDRITIYLIDIDSLINYNTFQAEKSIEQFINDENFSDDEGKYLITQNEINKKTNNRFNAVLSEDFKEIGNYYEEEINEIVYNIFKYNQQKDSLEKILNEKVNIFNVKKIEVRDLKSNFHIVKGQYNSAIKERVTYANKVISADFNITEINQIEMISNMVGQTFLFIDQLKESGLKATLINEYGVEGLDTDEIDTLESIITLVPKIEAFRLLYLTLKERPGKPIAAINVGYKLQWNILPKLFSYKEETKILVDLQQKYRWKIWGDLITYRNVNSILDSLSGGWQIPDFKNISSLMDTNLEFEVYNDISIFDKIEWEIDPEYPYVLISYGDENKTTAFDLILKKQVDLYEEEPVHLLLMNKSSSH